MKAATDFATQLVDAARPADVTENPFVHRLRDGIPPDALKRYGVATYSIAYNFPRILSSVLAVCDNQNVRRSLIGNLLEEEGVTEYVRAQGVTITEERRHGVLGRRFAYATGATDEELAAAPFVVPRWFTQELREGNWLGPFAYFAVGQEANVPPLYRTVIPLLRERYGFSDEALEFLTEHVTADDRHGLEAAMMIAEIATTEESRRKALEGARRGGRAWWELHRVHARGA
ncbi:MAG TPA: iron-containing redox enzyme family protein [Thermoanaerobaculia bacterium]